MPKSDHKKISVRFQSKPQRVKFGADTKGLPTFSMTAYTGVALRQPWSEHPVIVDLASLKVPSGPMAILHEHWQGDKVGHTTEIKNTGKKVLISGVISCTGNAAKDVTESGRNGFPWQASIGCENGWIDHINEGESVTVNGVKHEGPIDVYRDGELYETSFCVFGADNKTSAIVATSKRKEKAMKVTNILAGLTKFFKTKEGQDVIRIAAAKSKASDDDDEKDKDTEASDDKDDDEEEDPEASDDSDDEDEDEPEADKKASKKSKATKASRNVLAAESNRIAGIQRICAGKYPKIEEEAIRAGWSRDKTELAVLKAAKEQDRPKPPNIMRGASGSNGPARANIIAASALLNMGKSEEFVGKHFSQQEMNEATAAPNRSMSLNRIVAECIRAAASESGVHISSAEGLTGNGMWQHYVNAKNSIAAAGSSFSTISLPGILSNIANKSLLGAYEEVPRVFRKIARKASASDFKPSFSYRLFLKDGELQVIPPTGKIPSTTVDEEPYQRGIETRGTLLTLTRQMVINDDLDAFAQIPTMFGRAAANTIEKCGFDLLKSSKAALFTTTNRNLITANKPLSYPGLGEAVRKLAEQTDKHGNPINVTGKILLVPPALEGEAWVLLNSTHILATPTGKEKVGDKNRFHGMFTIVTTPFLASIHGKGDAKGSDDAWYLLADPNSIALFCTSYLDGREQPIIESETAAFDVLGFQYRVYHDFGINAEDFRAGVYSPGV